jgi:hypothetical protein
MASAAVDRSASPAHVGRQEDRVDHWIPKGLDCRAPLRMHRPLISMFGRRPPCLWGEYVGPCSTSAYAVWAMRQGMGASASCKFARRGGRRQLAAQCLPWAALCGLLDDTSRSGT